MGKTSTRKNKILIILLSICMILNALIYLSGCSMIESKVNELKGSITGNTYTCDFYTNTGDKFLTVNGENIDLNSNIVNEYVYSGNSWGYVQSLSSVVTITVDGNQIETCGSTVIFTESGLTPDVDFMLENIISESEGFKDYTMISSVVNKYKNAFGKPMVVVIQSQLGNPIVAYSGEKVYWEVCNDLPKTTKLMIDGKALYIHRANFVIIDTELLN